MLVMASFLLSQSLPMEKSRDEEFLIMA